MANKQKLNQTTNIFGTDHLSNSRAQPQKRQGYNLLTGESYDAPKPVSAPPKTVSQAPKVDSGPIQSNVRKGIAPVYVKNWWEECCGSGRGNEVNDIKIDINYKYFSVANQVQNETFFDIFIY